MPASTMAELFRVDTPPPEMRLPHPVHDRTIQSNRRDVKESFSSLLEGGLTAPVDSTSKEQDAPSLNPTGPATGQADLRSTPGAEVQNPPAKPVRAAPGKPVAALPPAQPPPGGRANAALQLPNRLVPSNAAPGPESPAPQAAINDSSLLSRFRGAVFPQPGLVHVANPTPPAGLQVGSDPDAAPLPAGDTPAPSAGGETRETVAQGRTATPQDPPSIGQPASNLSATRPAVSEDHTAPQPTTAPPDTPNERTPVHAAALPRTSAAAQPTAAGNHAPSGLPGPSATWLAQAATPEHVPAVAPFGRIPDGDSASPSGQAKQFAAPRSGDGTKERNPRPRTDAAAAARVVRAVLANSASPAPERPVHMGGGDPETPAARPTSPAPFAPTAMGVSTTAGPRAMVESIVGRLETARPGAESTPSDSPSPAEQVARAIRVQIGAQQSQVRLQLEPPELGQVRIDLRVSGNNLHLYIQSHTPLAHQLLQARAGELQRALEGQGLNVERVQFEFRHPAPGAHAHGRGDGGEAAARDAWGDSRSAGRDPAESESGRSPPGDSPAPPGGGTNVEQEREESVATESRVNLWA